MLTKKDFDVKCEQFAARHDDVFDDGAMKRFDPYEVEFSGDAFHAMFNLDCDDPTERKRAIDWMKHALTDEMNISKNDVQYLVVISVDGDEDFIEVTAEYDGDDLNENLNENYVVSTPSNLKKLPNGTKVRISGDKFYNADGDYVFLARKGRNAALCKVGSNDRMDEFWINSVMDRRIYDMMDSGAKIEVIDGSVDETTTVSNIAPTVDYVGHVSPGVYPGLPDNDTPEIYADKDEKEKDADLAAGDDAWVSPLGKLVAGESVRKVVGELI
jgi:hypothetical protein